LADILKIFTEEQLVELYRNYIISKSDITDFNEGGVVNSIIEANSNIISQISMDFKIAIFKAIPIALYEGFGFSQLSATTATGSLNPRRKPTIILRYLGAGSSAELTISATNFVVAVVGAPTDAINVAFTTYPKTSDLVTYIDGLTNWEADLINDVDSDTLYLYSGIEIKGKTDYNNLSGFDVMLQSDIQIDVSIGYSVTIDDITIQTTENGQILAGESKTSIASEASLAGPSGNISAESIDTVNGKGLINTSIVGINNVINFSAFSGGSEAESSTARAVRFSETVLSLNAGTVRGLEAAIKAIDGVVSAGIRENFPFKGTNTVVVDDGSGTISPELQTEVLKVINGDPNDFENYPGKGTAGIGYNVVAPTIIPVNVGITATRLSTINVDLDEIKVDIQSAVENYINTLQLGQNVLLSEIIKNGKNSNAAVYDLVVTSPVSNVAISDDEFARTGDGTGASVSVTVTIAVST